MYEIQSCTTCLSSNIQFHLEISHYGSKMVCKCNFILIQMFPKQTPRTGNETLVRSGIRVAFALLTPHFTCMTRLSKNEFKIVQLLKNTSIDLELFSFHWGLIHTKCVFAWKNARRGQCNGKKRSRDTACWMYFQPLMRKLSNGKCANWSEEEIVLFLPL